MAHNKKYQNRKAIMGNLHPRIERFYEKWGFDYLPIYIPQEKPNPVCHTTRLFRHCDGKPSREMDNLEESLFIGSLKQGELIIGGQNGRKGISF